MTMTNDELEKAGAILAAGDNGSTSTEDRGHTFRKRRLSLTNLRQLDESKNGDQAQQQPEVSPQLEQEEQQQQSGAEGLGYEEHTQELPSTVVATPPKQPEDHTGGDEKAHTFRKRRLSLTQNQQHQTDVSPEHLSGEEPPYQRRRRNSDVSVSSLDSHHHSKGDFLKTRIMHASELMSHPPLSPSNLPRLYHQSAPPQQPSALLDHVGESTPVPRWKKRHTRQLHEDERTLPFPRDIVGTFSCHGVEPIYDSDYLPEPEDEDDSDVEQETDVHGGRIRGFSSSEQQDKPTTAAKINQDRGGVAFPYGNCARTALFAAYDGHGQGGELVSQFALHEVQRRLEKHKDFTSNIEKAFKDTFLAVDEALKHEALIEPLYAGTTACVALLRENELIVANVGDSRAVLARRIRNTNSSEGKDGEGASNDADDPKFILSFPSAETQQLEAIDLSNDQNPDLPEEQSRIESMGGFVSPPPEPGLSARVWLDIGCTQIGLAMSRSLGDHAVKSIGVIAEPVVTTHHVTEDDEFMIIASDGVWEFVESSEAVQVVSENLHLGATRACQALIEMAAARWHDEEGDYRDDITALVIRLQHLWKSKDGKKPPSTTTSNLSPVAEQET